jgi:hypothetical protein
MRKERKISGLEQELTQPTGVIIVRVADGQCINSPWIDAGLLQIVHQHGATLAGIKQQAAVSSLDQKRHTVLAPET